MHNRQRQNLESALYVVATPIGNLRDITLRALDVLTSADVIAAEDTRNTSHLLTHHAITANKLISLHQHNERAASDNILALLAQGLSVALVTDAGTPAVSDPGALLIEAVHAADQRVIPIPGANAALAALSAGGLATPHFLFYGFLPNKSTARSRILQNLSSHPYTLVFYEAPHRIVESVTDLLTVLGGEREIIFAREITKMFESIHRCKLAEALEWLNGDPNRQRGEFVLLISGAPASSIDLSAEAEHTLKILLQELPLKQAVQLATHITQANRNALYQRALLIKNTHS